MRGTPVTSVLALVPMGIIPAYAGNTALRFAVPSLFWDHPRVCGEHLIRNDCRISGRGSSPRMRGTRWVNGRSSAVAGIIPAYAGNTTAGMDTCLGYWDHPRVCGEHMLGFHKIAVHQGSSPRMRGTLPRSAHGQISKGIIPAYAGNTIADMTMYAPSWGSSPRMRGTLGRKS